MVGAPLAETWAALASIGAALAPLAAEVTYVPDAGVGDIAVAGAIWQQGRHAVWRVRERDRLVRAASGEPPCHRWESAQHRWPLAPVEAEVVVRRGRQPRPKRQRVTDGGGSRHSAIDQLQDLSPIDQRSPTAFGIGACCSPRPSAGRAGS